MKTSSSRIVMRPAWSNLLFLHWPVSPSALQRLLPRGLEIDTFEGKAYVGLVPFEMSESHPNWMSPLVKRPWRHLSSDFLELNVRTYVKHKGTNPGVWFFSLDAASLPAVIAARLWFKLPYFWSRMSSHSQNLTCKYLQRRLWPKPLPARCALQYRIADDTPQVAAANSLDEFLLERYRLYSRRGQRLFCGQVSHEPYQWQRAEVLALEENVIRAAGIEVSGLPPLVRFARGVQVNVSPLQRL